MQVWEYEFRDVSPDRGWSSRRLGAELARFRRSFIDLGADGWELVSYQTVPTSGYLSHQAVFKRPTWVASDHEVLEANAVHALAASHADTIEAFERDLGSLPTYASVAVDADHADAVRESLDRPFAPRSSRSRRRSWTRETLGLRRRGAY